VDPQGGAVFVQFLILGLILTALNVLYESAPV
jgi:hypothetical protein